MNDMTPVPRSRQKPIAIRSDKAARALTMLTKNGRSQAEVIEDALDQALNALPKLTPDEFRARIDAIVEAAPRSRLTFKQVDDDMWDEFGLPI
jgi:hypothetical protein